MINASNFFVRVLSSVLQDSWHFATCRDALQSMPTTEKYEAASKSICHTIYQHSTSSTYQNYMLTIKTCMADTTTL